MRRFSAGSFALSALLSVVLAACEVTPTNPFDPDTAPDAQARATLRGTIVLDDATAADANLAAELADVVVTLLDQTGEPVTDDNGAALSPPLTIAGRTATFSVELVPGTVRVDVDGVPGRFTPPTLSPIVLGAGAVVDVGRLVYSYRAVDGVGGPGEIAGVVRLDGGSGAERTVGLYQKVGDTQVLLRTLVTDANGQFSAPGLPIGTYAVAASLDGFTPDYRLDVEVGEGDGQQLRQVFSGDSALALHPITAVLLPLLERTDGSFYTRDDDVPLAVLAFGGVSGMRLGTAACDQPAPACADFVFANDDGADDAVFADYDASATQALPDVEGRVGVFAQFEARSPGGFRFVSPVFSTTVIRDVTPPAIRSVAVLGAAPAASVVATDDDLGFVVDVDDTGGVAAIGHVLAPTAPAADGVTFAVVSTTPGAASLERIVALPAADGVSNAWFFVRDRAGNVSTPATVEIVKDTAPASALPIVIEAVTPRENRAVDVVVSFDASTATELPVEVQLAVGALPADGVAGRVPFADSTFVVPATAVDGETLIVRARLFDAVGNVTEVFASTVVSLRGTVRGTIGLERLGSTVQLDGTTVTALGTDGRVLATATTNAAGAYTLPAVVEGRASLVASAAGYRGVTQDLGFVEADATATLDGFLTLQRGSLVGSVRLADLVQFDDRHGTTTVEVRLVSQTRSAAPRSALTSSSGDWALDLVPATIVGETYQVVATAEGYGTGVVNGVVVADNDVTVVTPDANDPTTPTPVLLQPISGDFDLCATAQVGGCTPIAFTNQLSVRVKLRDDNGVTRLRAAAGTLPDEATLPLTAYDEDAGVVVTLPDVQGTIEVFADVERDGGRQTLGPVVIFRDTVAPRAPVVTVARGDAARRDGFTNQGFVRATVVLDAADADDRSVESPLQNAPTFFSTTVPTEPRTSGVAFCADGVACTVVLPSLAGVVDERRHDLFAFACDAAGNCSVAAGRSAIVFDKTPPSALHGVALRPTGTGLVTVDSDSFRTKTGAYAVAIDVGAAKTAADVAVLDTAGAPVRDVDAVALSFVAAIDARDAVTIVGADSPGATATVAGLPLLGGENAYDVFARFIDAAGNSTAIEPNPFGFTLTLDETAPTGRLTLAAGAAITNSRTVSVLVDNVSEANTRSKLVTDAASCQSAAGYVATNALSATTSLVDLDGAQVVIACLSDDVGNVGFASDSIVLDRVAPVGSVVLDGGAAFSASRNLVASFTGTSADVARVKAVLRRTTTAATSCAVSTGYVAFASSVAVSVPLADPAGTYVVDACFEDTAGNRTALPASDSILFDTTPPTVTIVLNDDDAFTTTSDVRASITATDDLPVTFTSMRFSSSTTFAGPGEGFATTRAGLVVNAPTVEGAKTICVEVTDELGRTAIDCDDIVLDLSAPAGTLTAPAFATSSPITVSVRSDDLNIQSVAVGEGIDCTTATFTALASATTVARTIALTDTTTSGARSLVACFKDAAGRVARVERTTTVDFTDPPLATALAPVSGAVVATRRPTFAWSAVEGAATYTLIVRRVVGGTVELTRAGLTGLSFTPTADLPEVALEWIVVVTKASGRASAQSFTAAARVTPDVTAPSPATTIVIAVDANRTRITAPAPCSTTAPCVNDNTPRLSFTAGTDAVDTSLVHTLQIANAGDTAFASPVFVIDRLDGSAFDVGVALDNGVFKIRVKSVDDAGNVATSAVFDLIVDRAAPDAPSILPIASPVSSSLAGNIVVGWTPEGPTGAVAYRLQLTTESRTFANPLLDEVLVGVLATSRDIKSLLVPGGRVVHQVRVAAIDALGNQSSFAVAGFVNDTTAPCGNGRTLTILGTDAANGFTDSAAVVVQVDCASDPADPFDGPVKMQLGCDGTAAGKPRVAFNGVASCVLNGADGNKSAQAVVFDEAGNATVAFTDSIVLDRRVPTTPVLSIDSVVTNDPQFTFAIVEPSTDANFLRHEFIDGVDITSFDDVLAVVTGNSIELSLDQERTYNVRVRGIDRAGNTSPEAIVAVTFDSTKPTRPNIADNDVPVVVNAASYTIFLTSGANDAHFDHYELQTNAGPFVEVAGDGVFTVPLTADTTTIFRLRGVDEAGNVGDDDQITVVEDSRNPRPIALAALPAVMNGGAPRAFSSSTFTSRGAYVDVHFARTETITAASIDANFDHFEVRATHPSFINFVPLCATATALCKTTVLTDGGVSVVGADHLIAVGSNVAGFRVPLVRGVSNAITVRAVDKAGNVSVETSVTTKEISSILVTADDAVEVESSLFGDRLAYVDISASPPMALVRLPGKDALLGTSDDTLTNLRQPSTAAGGIGNARQQVIAQGPDIVVLPVTVAGVTRLFGYTGGADRDISTAPVEVGPLNQDPAKGADQPSIWGARLAFRQFEGGVDTDIYVRDGGVDRAIGTGDDVVTKVADDAVFQFFPQLSGEQLAFFSCNTSSCTGVNEPRLVVVHAGADRRFGTSDDATRTLTQAVNVDHTIRPQLYTPGTAGRAACRNVVAWAGKASNKGVHVVTTGPDGFFDVDDTPVQVMNAKASNTSSGMRAFALYDDVVVASDFFGVPAVEMTTGGPDGCLTRTADNVVFDSGLDSSSNHLTVHDGRVIASRFSPTADLLLLELGAERVLWPRTELYNSPNVEADLDGVVAGGGGFFDLVTHSMRQAFTTPTAAATSSSGNIMHGAISTSSLTPAFTPLSITQRGVDEIRGTADDRVVVVTTTRPAMLGRNTQRSRNATFAIDGDTALWAGQKPTTTLVVPVVRNAGADRLFGTADDCEVEVGVAAEAGYESMRSSRKRQAFQRCGEANCNASSPAAAFGTLFVREVTGNICTGTSTVTALVNNGTSPDIDGPRFVYVDPQDGNAVKVIDAGADRRLATTADNIETRVSQIGVDTGLSPRISGDRVIWIDSRFEIARAVVGDLADGSERVVSRSVTGVTSPSIAGDLFVFATALPGSSFDTDVVAGYFGIQPDLPQDQRALGPTQLRCPDDDRYEENDSSATATPLNNGASINGIVCAGDEDRFKINVPAVGCVVRAKARFVHAEGNLDMSLIDPVNTTVTSATATNDEAITFTATRAGDHIVRLFGAATVENTWDVGVTVSCP